MVKSKKIIKISYFSFLLLVFLFSLISNLIQSFIGFKDLTGLNLTYEILITVFVCLTNLSAISVALFGLIKAIKENNINNRIINIALISLISRDLLYLATYLFSFGFTFHKLGVNTLDTKGILLVMLLIYDIVFLFLSLFINYNLSKKNKSFIVTISMVFSLFTIFAYILGHAIYLTPLDIISIVLIILMFVFTIVFMYFDFIIEKIEKRKLNK